MMQENMRGIINAHYAAGVASKKQLAAIDAWLVDKRPFAGVETVVGPIVIRELGAPRML
jgi:hypothetical protein